jgi:hypothetical protein
MGLRGLPACNRSEAPPTTFPDPAAFRRARRLSHTIDQSRAASGRLLRPRAFTGLDGSPDHDPEAQNAERSAVPRARQRQQLWTRERAGRLCASAPFVSVYVFAINGRLRVGLPLTRAFTVCTVRRQPLVSRLCMHGAALERRAAAGGVRDLVSDLESVREKPSPRGRAVQEVCGKVCLLNNKT